MVPKSLRTWFIVHFWADILAAVPLLIAPKAVLGMLGWQCVDPISARIVGAALMGIGIESLLGRDQGYEAYRGMLTLKVIWASTCVLGIGVSMLQGGPPMGWAVFGIFVAFDCVWSYYRIQLHNPPADAVEQAA